MPTQIEWTEETWEIVQGCTPVSEGCRNCWAERLARTRLKRFYPEGFGEVVLRHDQRDKPLHWRKPRKVFVCSRSDLFHEAAPYSCIRDAFTVMMMCGGGRPRDVVAGPHTFQVLTKRPDRMLEFAIRHNLFKRMRAPEPRPWPENVWAGVSVENQEWADKRLPLLAQVPARVRFVSLEPLLGPVDLRPWLSRDDGDGHCTRCGELREEGHECPPGSGLPLSWVIVGGESGPNARPMEVEWLADVVAQCREAGVPVFVKQDSGPRPGMQGRIPDELWALKQYPETE